jgi:hypothetical protein
MGFLRAGNGTRTRDLLHGKQTHYQLCYTRIALITVIIAKSRRNARVSLVVSSQFTVVSKELLSAEKTSRCRDCLLSVRKILHLSLQFRWRNIFLAPIRAKGANNLKDFALKNIIIGLPAFEIRSKATMKLPFLTTIKRIAK